MVSRKGTVIFCQYRYVASLRYLIKTAVLRIPCLTSREAPTVLFDCQKSVMIYRSLGVKLPPLHGVQLPNVISENIF